MAMSRTHQMASAIMKTGRYLNNAEMKEIYRELFGEEPKQREFNWMKTNIFESGMYETRHRMIRGIKCIRVMSIDGKKGGKPSHNSAGHIEEKLYRPDATQKLINSVLRG